MHGLVHNPILGESEPNSFAYWNQLCKSIIKIVAGRGGRGEQEVGGVLVRTLLNRAYATLYDISMRSVSDHTTEILYKVINVSRVSTQVSSY